MERGERVERGERGEERGERGERVERGERGEERGERRERVEHTAKVFSKTTGRGKIMKTEKLIVENEKRYQCAVAGETKTTTQTLADLYAKGYRLKKFCGLNRPAKGFDPIGVGLFEKRGDFFESVIYERFGQWLYATPEKLVRDDQLIAEVTA